MDEALFTLLLTWIVDWGSISGCDKSQFSLLC